MGLASGDGGPDPGLDGPWSNPGRSPWRDPWRDPWRNPRRMLRGCWIQGGGGSWRKRSAQAVRDGEGGVEDGGTEAVAAGRGPAQFGVRAVGVVLEGHLERHHKGVEGLQERI